MDWIEIDKNLMVLSLFIPYLIYFYAIYITIDGTGVSKLLTSCAYELAWGRQGGPSLHRVMFETEEEKKYFSFYNNILRKTTL